ncbi:hypothetical protein BACCELL_01206 [Bacteroides cellulosilyticus DSM 14838]|uniref:Uncharacterized protein n=1 Tax=Bacteroides cellulosilyticus DSM 14838 TaxID=537012 RepID=E2NAA3_9BACE|nr:hypothetical protein BACCELL_01206 [Bacteroides cellulosilyticus DSM 14838]
MASYQENFECARKKTEIFYKKLLSLKKEGNLIIRFPSTL